MLKFSPSGTASAGSVVPPYYTHCQMLFYLFFTFIIHNPILKYNSLSIPWSLVTSHPFVTAPVFSYRNFFAFPDRTSTGATGFPLL